MKKYIFKTVVLAIIISTTNFSYPIQGHELIGSSGQLYLYSLASAGISSIFSLLTLPFSSFDLKHKVITAGINALLSAAVTKVTLPFLYGNTRFTKPGEVNWIRDEDGYPILDEGGWIVAQMPLFGDQLFSDLKQFPMSVAKTVIMTNVAITGATMGSLYLLGKND